MRKAARDMSLVRAKDIEQMSAALEESIEQGNIDGAIEYLADIVRAAVTLINYLHNNDPKT